MNLRLTVIPSCDFSIVPCLLSHTKPGLTRDLPEEQQEKEEQAGRQLGRGGVNRRETVVGV